LSRPLALSCWRNRCLKQLARPGRRRPAAHELLILRDKAVAQKTFDLVYPLVSRTVGGQIPLLTSTNIPLTAGSRNKTYINDRAPPTHLQGACRPRRRRFQVRLSRGSTCRLSRHLLESRVSNIDGEKLKQNHHVLKEASIAPLKTKKWASALPRQAAISAAYFRACIGTISGTTD
jgi:hypothetical protein